MSKKTKDISEINICIDEIRVSQEKLVDKKVSKKIKKLYEGWIRTQKIKLKELGYEGKIPRKKVSR